MQIYGSNTAISTSNTYYLGFVISGGSPEVSGNILSLVTGNQNGTVNSYSHRGNMNISSTFTPGDYPMNIIFKGGGTYNVCYRTVIIRVTA
jgi:hypothetical protein